MKKITPYEAYQNRYISVKESMKAKNQYITEMYTESEFSTIYEKAKANLTDIPKDRIIQYIVYRQKKYIELF